MMGRSPLFFPHLLKGTGTVCSMADDEERGTQSPNPEHKKGLVCTSFRTKSLISFEKLVTISASLTLIKSLVDTHLLSHLHLVAIAIHPGQRNGGKAGGIL